MKKVLTTTCLLLYFIASTQAQIYRILTPTTLYKNSDFPLGRLTPLERGDTIQAISKKNDNLYLAKYKNLEGYVEIASIEEIYDNSDTTKHYYFPSGEVMFLYEKPDRYTKYITIRRSERMLLKKHMLDGWSNLIFNGKEYYGFTSALTTERYSSFTETSAPKSNSYTPSSSSHEPSRTIHTGPRGGRYYINSNGNKTYIKRK